jgi:exopolyphosphatase/guanosine-5'-triphosphate,3'-diphosphate pyrophosphatase
MSTPRPATPDPQTFAAVDLGSNSFHMIVANYSDGRLQIIDRIKDMVRLASGLDQRRNLNAEASERALQCLERFGQRIRELPRGRVRVVGTNTLRQARNGRAFLARARQALGHPIEVIAGREEARLIFLGVAHTIYNETEKRLVVDIGGGSTELIIGRGYTARHMESLYMGCVNVSEKYFGDGEISAKRMRRAMLFARQELESIEQAYRKAGWDSAIGASGTIQAIGEVIREKGWSDDGITARALTALREALVDAGRIDKFTAASLSERRRPVFGGGVAILSAVFEALGIERMTVSEGALREGLLYELIGRTRRQDVRDQTIRDLATRYAVDADQARRVEASAQMLFAAVQVSWALDPEQDAKLLAWAAQTHEIGLSVAHAQYHRHGAYLLTFSDMPGFSRQEQFNLAMLVRLHRRSFEAEEMEEAAETDRVRLRCLTVLLRLAVLLHRSRSANALPEIGIHAANNFLRLTFPKDWLAEHPLTQTDLESEAELLRESAFTLEFA